MSEALNPRAVVGDNLGVDQAQIVNDRLSLDYAESAKTLQQLRSEAAVLKGVKVTSDEEAVARGSVIKQFRDLDNRLEAFREAEKQPFLRGGNAVDNFFFDMRDQIARRKKGDRSVKPGDADILQADIDEWQNAKIAAERARLEQERLEAARLAREHATALRKAQEAADEAARAAARARSRVAQQAKTQIAMDMADREADAKAAADLAAEQAEEARLATLVRPADISRVRGNDAQGGGVMLTTAREGYAMVVDRDLLDVQSLAPYLTTFELEKALRAWAKANGYQKQMAGAEIGFRNKGVTR
jgi:hypothetical protein